MAPSICNVKFWRVLVLGLGFMLIFTAFQTSTMVEQSVIDGAIKEPNSTFKGNGFISLATIYATFAVLNWIAPPIVSLLGPVVSMICGAVPYLLFIVSFLKPMTWSLYTGSALVGFGASVLWTSQGNYLTINSDAETLTRNSGLFWALFQSSLLIGNLYVYIAFAGDIVIEKDMRMTLYIILSSVCGAGILIFFVLFCLRISSAEEISLNINIRRDSVISNSEVKTEAVRESQIQERGGAYEAWHAFKRAFQLLCTKQMLLLSVTFAFTGLELTFFSGVYGTCVGHSLDLGKNAKSYIGFSGIFIGVGEIVGGTIFGLFGKRTNKYGRDPIVLIGFLAMMVTCFLTYLNLPNNSPFGNTAEKAHIPSNAVIVVVCGFVFGFGDSSYNTQLYSMLGDLYKDDSAPAFALFKFVQSLAAAVAFFYSSQISLQWQLLILVVTSTLGCLTFIIVEWSNFTLRRQYDVLSEVDHGNASDKPANIDS